MPVGIGAAVGIGGALIGGGATLLAGSKAAKAQTKAAKTAADSSLEVAKLNNALFEKIRAENKGILSPFSDRGGEASGVLNSLLVPGSGTPDALDAFARFREGTNYKWRLSEGLNSLKSGFAARGALDSGAANNAAIAFNQNLASEELGNYMNLLAGQQSMGLGAAAAVAGVGTNYAGNVSAQNTNASNAASNAALAAGQAKAGQWAGIGQLGGSIGGALFQYGMGQMRPPQYPAMSMSPMMGTQSLVPQSYPMPSLPSWGGN